MSASIRQLSPCSVPKAYQNGACRYWTDFFASSIRSLVRSVAERTKTFVPSNSGWTGAPLDWSHTLAHRNQCTAVPSPAIVIYWSDQFRTSGWKEGPYWNFPNRAPSATCPKLRRPAEGMRDYSRGTLRVTSCSSPRHSRGQRVNAPDDPCRWRR